MARFSPGSFERDWYAPTVVEGWLWDDRHYDLFAILGNVRNGFGFAGVQRGTGFNYISDSRGLPEDASPDLEIEFEEGYYHSNSYVNLPELLDYDWDQTSTHYGTVQEEQYKVFKEKGKPRSWSGSISGQSVVELTNEQMDELVARHIAKEQGITYVTRVSWEEAYKESVATFYERCIPQLKELSSLPDYSDVRIVFGFDS